MADYKTWTMDEITAKRKQEQDAQFEKIWSLVLRVIDARISGNVTELAAVREVFKLEMES